ncbi:MAG: L-threonylcarbamoyladenylate synthase [Candidatus Andersenbacteria bacterium]|nr:L-threonylcarbamoyladenylate synthase [Candidatus Andersenbacteria bacterium]MBI3250379.1 L-threonylcarbamoyladenylate synthase [Candidatus Andersenbacteria bacterium]
MPDLTPITKDIKVAVHIITEGRVVAVPTGTSYGLAADALQGNALQRVRNLKHRPDEKTFTVFLKQSLWEEFFDITNEEIQFLQKYDGQALTLILTPKDSLAHIAQDGRVGLRVIDHPLMASLAEAVEVPLTATSANVSGQEACYDTTCVTTTFPGLLDPTDTRHGDIKRAGKTTYDLSLGCILDGGNLQPGRQSTIIRLEESIPIVIREGSLKLQ